MDFSLQAGKTTTDYRYTLKVLAHFKPKQVVDFSTYNTQLLCLTGAIISKAHDNDKYNYAKDSVPPQNTLFSGVMLNYN